MFCPVCGKQSAPNANFCSACGTAALPGHVSAPQGRIVRPFSPRMVAGVCAGFAIHFGWDVSMVRILLCVFTILTSGIGLLCYLAAWVLLPEAPYAVPAMTQVYPAQPPVARPYSAGFDRGQGTGV